MSALLLYSIVGAADDTSVAMLRECARAADEDAVGLVELNDECPEIETVLVHAGFAPFLSEAQSDELSSAALADLADIYSYFERQPSPPARTLQTDGIAGIVDRLQQQPQAQHLPSLREQFMRWLRQWFDQGESGSSSWLAEWLKQASFPDIARQVVVWSLVGLVLILAVVVLVNEMRAAGWLRRSRMQQTTRGHRVTDSPLRELTFADLDAAAVRDKPSILLRLVLSALVQSGRLPTERSLTLRELTARVSLDAQVQRDRFQDIAVSAERARYGVESLSAAQVDKLVADGRALYGEITAAQVTQ